MNDPTPLSTSMKELNLLRNLLDRYWEILISSHNDFDENTERLLKANRSNVIDKIEVANQIILKIERLFKLQDVKDRFGSSFEEIDNDNVDFVTECLKENDWNNEKLVIDAVRKVKKTIN